MQVGPWLGERKEHTKERGKGDRCERKEGK